MLSFTTTLQVASNTQFISGATTLTTFRNAACALADASSAAVAQIVGNIFMSPPVLVSTHAGQSAPAQSARQGCG
jgi:hypothetical protein